ncbi:MAG: MATE family efflux transporter [Spirochaetia bacterium]|nr:MATE family efflux transporter [Spirochaetia bacterium]
MKAAVQSKDFMGTQPMGSLLAKLSIPAMIGMMVNAMYNLVDTIFVGQGAGPLAIAGLSIAFPVQMLIGAFAQMYGVGSASIISRKLGEKKPEAAAAAAGTAITLTIITAVLITIIGSLFIHQILSVFGATDDILPYATEYLSIILFGSAFLSFSMCSNNIIRAEGAAKVAMTIMIIGTGLNLILDPIFIFGFDMGIRGAALATVISQVISAAYALIFFLRGKSSIEFTRQVFFVKAALAFETIILGMSTFVRQIGTSLMALAVNNMLKIYGGDMAIAAFGMINRLMIFFLMPIFGIIQGFQPIAGYNYGAKKFDRVKKVLLLGIGVASLMGTFSTLVIELFPRTLLSMFTSDQALLDLAAPALRIVMITMPLIGIQAIGATLFQSIGKSLPALLLGLSRQFIILIPLVLILPRFMGLSGVWYSFPIADLTATGITLIWLFHEVRNLNRIHFESLNPVEEYPVR